MSNSNITKNIIAGAMRQLMQEMPFAKISIGDIVQRCGLNRNSFYYHFRDKYDLVNWIFYTDFAQAMQDVGQEDSWESLERICQFFYRDKVFYNNALSITGQNSFYEYFLELMSSVLETRAEEMFEDDEDRRFYTTFFVDSFLTMLSRWLREGATIPPERLSRLIKNMLTGVATRVIQIEESAR